jgi:DNA-binding beta-propeller fold protein YncE
MRRCWLTSLALLAALLPNMAACSPRPASTRDEPPLVLERTIPLAAGSGRIDHMALDSRRGRLFVAELGAGAVEAVDLASGKSIGHIGGLKEPQGVGYLADRDELVVASGGDGSVRFYRGADLSPLGTLELGDDADNVRIDAQGRVVVGYGSGALAVIDPASRGVLSRLALPAHPESFQLDRDRAYVNLPDAGKIAVADLAKGQVVALWPNPAAKWNFPMALAKDSDALAVVYRLPAQLVVFAASTGKVDQRLETCSDADDVFFDTSRQRIYVSCGSGAVDVFERLATGYTQAARVPTREGARTALFSPGLDRLFVAARAGVTAPAAILVYRPL